MKQLSRFIIGKMIWLSLALGILYWVLDAVLDSLVFHTSSFAVSMISPDAMCLAMRLINWAIITGFAGYAQYMLLKRRAIEEVLKKERDKAQKYLDVAGVIMLAVERDQTVSLINRMGCTILGCEERDVLGKNWFDHFVPESEREMQKRAFEALLQGREALQEYHESPVLTKLHGERTIAWHNSLLTEFNGTGTGLLSSGADITELKKSEQEREKLIRELQTALSEARMLGSLLPICASCKKIRDDQGYWHQVEVYIGSQTGTKFTHGICPDCRQKYYAQIEQWTKEDGTKTN